MTNYNQVKERVLKAATLTLQGKTIREIAKVTKWSKSCVHRDLRVVLRVIDSVLFQEVDSWLKFNLEIGHLRGGDSTRKKYSKLIQ